jgi:purine-binding chemotaxis protein CheW
MDEPGTVTAAVVERRRAGKYLTFGLGEQAYGLEILKVREIIGMVPITPVPGTPDSVRGVINLRGKVIPVTDLRAKFSMTPAEQTDETCIIVVQVRGHETGIVVDRVQEVRDIAEADIEDTPSFGTSIDTEFILGMGKADGQVTILLEIGRVLTGDTQLATADLEPA